MKSLQANFAASALAVSLALLGGQPANAQVFVSDYNGSSGISEYSLTGTFLRTFVALGSGGLSAPSNLVWGPDGNLYVASSGNGSIKKYDGSSGAFLGNVVTGLGTTYDAAFGKDGNLYVPDYNANAAYKINPTTGAILQTFTGGLNRPEGVAILSDGNLVVGSGSGSNPVEFNTTTGTSFTFGTGIGVNVGLTTGPDGRVYFTEFSSGAIGVMPATGGAATTFSTGGFLSHPQYIAYGNGSFFVGSIANSTVQYFNATTGAFQGSFSAPSATGIAIRNGVGSAAAPEPASAALLLLAIPGFAARRRRRAANRINNNGNPFAQAAAPEPATIALVFPMIGAVAAGARRRRNRLH